VNKRPFGPRGPGHAGLAPGRQSDHRPAGGRGEQSDRAQPSRASVLASSDEPAYALLLSSDSNLGDAALGDIFDLVKTETMQIQAEGWNHYLRRQIERRWEPVCRAWFPEGVVDSVDWTWTFFQYVFPLADPRDFPCVQKSSWSSSEQHVLSRYISHARDLAGTVCLRHPTAIRFIWRHPTQNLRSRRPTQAEISLSGS
jgi:hypothetical protein